MCVCVGFVICGCVCMYGFCNVWVCVCGSFVMCGCLLICVLVLIVLCVVCIVFLCCFVYVLSELLYGLLPPSDKSTAVSINNNNNK